MPDVADFAALLTSLRTLADLAKTLIDARDAAVVRAKAIELQREIIATQNSAIVAQAAQSTLLKQVGDLEKEVAQLKAWDAEREKYELQQLRPAGTPGGEAFAYVLKTSTTVPEPSHKICPHCYENRQKSLLQGITHPGNVNILFCHRCGLEINLTGIDYNLDPRRPRRSRV